MDGKKVVLITGGGPNGVTGKLFKELLIDEYIVLSPGSQELDLTDDAAVDEFFNTHHIDYVIHCATFRPNTNVLHMVDEELESNLRMYFALAKQAPKVKKIIYFGSGAEYNKARSIINMSEDEIGQSIPFNRYGFGKFIMNRDCRKSENIYNFRLFGTINKYERPTKNVVSNICLKVIKGLPINLRQDCRFSFIDMNDVLLAVKRALSMDLLYHDYNLVLPQTYLLSDIANRIIKISGKDLPITFQTDGLNLEYTGCGQRFYNEFNPKFSPINYSLQTVYNYYLQIADSINVLNIDKRWK